MTQPPRSAQVGLLSWATLWRALAVGGAGLALVVALQVGARAGGWSDEWSRAAALGSVVMVNVAMLIWFRTGAHPLHRHPGNHAFAWLLAALCGACGLVLSVAPLTRQFGLPVSAALQSTGFTLAGFAVLSSLWLWRKVPA